VRDFIDNQTIDIAINYPRSTLKVPAIVILLKSESEFQAFLNDSMGVDLPDDFSYYGESLAGELIGSTSISDLSGEGKIVFGPLTADGGTNNTIRTLNDEFDSDQFTGKNYDVRIVAGLGKGQIRKITGNNANTIMVSQNWVTNPDDTSIFEVRSSADEVLGQPAKIYDRSKSGQFIERKGGYYTQSYQIQVISNNPESTIFLYAILKAIFTLSRLFMEKHGLINMKMGGTDFLPRAEYLPDFAYMRAINLEFQTSFEIFEDISTGIESFQTCIDFEAPISVRVGAVPVSIE
jgi:hypothetical protein